MRFVIPGRPQPQERPLVLKRGWTVDRPKSRSAKKIIGQVALASRQTHRLSILDGDVAVSLMFYGAHGSSDIDNLAKLVLDSLKGIIWNDDRQVVSLQAIKVKSEDPRTEVNIEAA